MLPYEIQGKNSIFEIKYDDRCKVDTLPLRSMQETIKQLSLCSKDSLSSKSWYSVHGCIKRIPFDIIRRLIRISRSTIWLTEDNNPWKTLIICKKYILSFLNNFKPNFSFVVKYCYIVTGNFSLSTTFSRYYTFYFILCIISSMKNISQNTALNILSTSLLRKIKKISGKWNYGIIWKWR